MAQHRGRPRNPNTDYKITVHNKHGIAYAITQPRDPSKKSGRREVTWGTFDPGTKKFHPFAVFLNQRKSERDRLVFPENWDMSEVTDFERKVSDDIHPSSSAYSSRYWGATWFFGKVAEASGVRSGLERALNSGIRTDMGLTLAVVPSLLGKTLQQLKSWQRVWKPFTEVPLTPQVICKFMQSITDEEVLAFLTSRREWEDGVWKKIQDKGKQDGGAEASGKSLEGPVPGKKGVCRETLGHRYAAVDTTSVSTWGTALVQIRWGHHKEKLPLRQTIEVVVYSLITHLPIFYMELPGNTPDSRTLDMLARELMELGFTDIVFLTDRGFETMANIEKMILSGKSVLTCCSVHRSEIMDKIRELEQAGDVTESMRPLKEDDYYAYRWETPYTMKDSRTGKTVTYENVLTYLYYSPKQRDETRMSLDRDLAQQEEELEDVKKKGVPYASEDDRNELRAAYPLMDIEFDDDGHVSSFVRDKAKIGEAVLCSGFHALKTVNLDISPETAHRDYSYRDEQEKSIKMRKASDTNYRLRCWSELSMKGRDFVWFVGLILESYIKNVWEQSQALRDKFQSSDDIIYAMQDISIDEFADRSHVIHPFVADQLLICKEFGFEVPTEADIPVASGSFSAKKRGRPRKSDAPAK